MDARRRGYSALVSGWARRQEPEHGPSALVRVCILNVDRRVLVLVAFRAFVFYFLVVAPLLARSMSA